MIADVEAAERVVRLALPNYSTVADGTLEFVKYRENWVFRLDHDATSYAVRVHRLGYRSDAELLEELELLVALGKEGVPVPGLRPTLTGREFCHVVDDSGDVYQVDMLNWVEEGIPLGDIGAAFLSKCDIEPEDFRRLGALMAQLHVSSAKLFAEAASVRGSWDRDGLIGPRPLWGDPMRAFMADEPEAIIISAAMAHLSDLLIQYGTAPDRYGPIHADFTPENVLVHRGQMTLIDFDDSGNGYYLFDLATAAFFYLPHPRYGDVLSSLFEGYESVRPLSGADRSMWHPMLFARGLTYLGWATERLGDETSEFLLEHVRPAVVSLARELLGRPSSMEATYSF